MEGYPAYKKKRNNGENVQVGNYHVDNRYVVPFNKYILKKNNISSLTWKSALR